MEKKTDLFLPLKQCSMQDQKIDKADNKICIFMNSTLLTLD